MKKIRQGDRKMKVGCETILLYTLWSEKTFLECGI